jgi:hypothetical protein
LWRNWADYEKSEFEVRATISYKGQTANGIFTFNEQYELISFTTNDRAITGTDGSMEYVPWSAICKDYQRFKFSSSSTTSIPGIASAPLFINYSS